LNNSMNAYVLTTLIALQACGGAVAPRPAPPVSAEADEYLSLEDATALCVHLHEEMVSCAPELMDLIIELRRRYDPSWPVDHPSPDSEAEAKAVGIEELKNEGTGPLEPRQELCRGYARSPKTPRAVPATLEPCFKISECKQKVECTRPVMETRFRARAEAAVAGAQSNK
jgi:hypothetical protein